MVTTKKPTDLLKVGDELNGFTIVRVGNRNDEEGVLLAVKDRTGQAGPQKEYVTARFSERSLSFKEWWLGHYSTNEEESHKDYAERLKL